MEQIQESLSALLIPIYDAEGRLDTMGAIFWCIFLAVVAVFISVRVQNGTVGKIIRTLREKKAETEETAIPLTSLGKVPERVLKGSGTLFATVKDEEGTERIYLPEKSGPKADALLKAGATPLWLAILEIVGLYALLFTIYQFLPWLLEQF